jgi:hypothetical protein
VEFLPDSGHAVPTAVPVAKASAIAISKARVCSAVFDCVCVAIIWSPLVGSCIARFRSPRHAASGLLRMVFSVRDEGGLRYFTSAFHDGLPEFLGLVADDLSLPTDELQATIANKVIELASAGERNPDILCERVLEDIRRPTDEPSV